MTVLACELCPAPAVVFLPGCQWAETPQHCLCLLCGALEGWPAAEGWPWLVPEGDGKVPEGAGKRRKVRKGQEA